jgi:hypothetical protein
MHLIEATEQTRGGEPLVSLGLQHAVAFIAEPSL